MKNENIAVMVYSGSRKKAATSRASLAIEKKTVLEEPSNDAGGVRQTKHLKKCKLQTPLILKSQISCRKTIIYFGYNWASYSSYARQF